MMAGIVEPSHRRGASLIEFTFVGIPLIFILISIFEMARGMWIYATLAHALKEGTRYAAVHGSGYKAACLATSPADPAICQVDLQRIAEAINFAGAGLIPTDVVNVQFAANGVGRTCGGANTLEDCLTGGAGVTWSDSSLAAGSPIAVSAQYRFPSAIALFWPGSGTVQIGEVNLPGSSQELIQF
jgi:Flp pilus assembly protein TadG